MRRKFTSGNPEAEDEQEINITPLLDVVFIILIFFIVTATFVKEAGIEVTRPDAETAQMQERANIFIAISDNNEIWIDGQQIDIRALRTNIERLHAEYPEGSVVIQADTDSVTEMLIEVMDAARQAGVFNVSIAATEN